MQKHREQCQLAVIGMGVMGRALAENFASQGFRTAIWNLEYERSEQVALDFEAYRAAHPEAGALSAFRTLSDLAQSLEAPRIFVLMVTAGEAVDSVIEALLPQLSVGDIVIDAGNSHYRDSLRRFEALRERSLVFVGMGVSGGEEGARRGPSMMPAASEAVYARLKPYLEAIAAKTESGPCVTRLGSDGAGHFVKMVHNGIEYADMQLIAEIYQLMHRVYGLAPLSLAKVFEAWSEGPLSSYLIDITAEIFKKRDPEQPSGFLVDAILDRAGQKGTGSWTVQAALELGVAVPAIAAAVDARVISSQWERRQALAKAFASEALEPRPWNAELASRLHDALLAGKILAYQQGFQLLAVASERYQWNLDFREIARIWKGGCIIRARFLDVLMQRFEEEPKLNLLMESAAIREDLSRLLPALRESVKVALETGCPVPVLSSSLAYLEQYSCARMPQNLTQAQRDYFGAHRYQRLDAPEGASLHTQW